MEKKRKPAAGPKTPIDAFRNRQKRAGIVRVEVKVAKEDAPLLRSVARALGDPKRQSDMRRLLTSHITPPAISLKELLMSAPLDGIDLTRSRDPGRDVDL